jgi:hypothetical protein
MFGDSYDTSDEDTLPPRRHQRLEPCGDIDLGGDDAAAADTAALIRTFEPELALGERCLTDEGPDPDDTPKRRRRGFSILLEAAPALIK